MDNREILNINHLSGYEFEELVARIMRRRGYSNIKVTKKSGDMGKDIIMEYKENGLTYPVVVECKHQKVIGRPVVQKLQGALIHEKGSNRFAKGILVTSGSFSPSVEKYVTEINRKSNNELKIELIDGEKLREICELYNILILNKKIQILTKNVVKFADEKEVKEGIRNEFEQIIGSETKLFECELSMSFHPCYYIKYNIHCDFDTKTGTIHSIHENKQEIVFDGITGNELDLDHFKHFFTLFPRLTKLSNEQEKKVIPFKFTENKIEKNAIMEIIDSFSEEISYTGRNNVSYSKFCRPKEKDILITDNQAIYLPKYIIEVTIKDYKYTVETFLNEKEMFHTINEMDLCVECKEELDERFLCRYCGKILCSSHRKLDFFDKTPLCETDRIKRRLFLQNIYFKNKKNLAKFNKLWENKSLLAKLVTDKILTGSIITLILLIIIIIVN